MKLTSMNLIKEEAVQLLMAASLEGVSLQFFLFLLNFSDIGRNNRGISFKAAIYHHNQHLTL